MKRATIAATAFVLLTTSCIGGGASTRIVLVDHEHDVFASYFTAYFPNHIEAHPGDKVVFRQTWTGEPHSVTMGKIVDKYGQLLKPYLKIFAKKGYAGIPQTPPKNIKSIDDALSRVGMTDQEGNVGQNGAQPCFLKKGLPPTKTSKPCPKADQRQPMFDGSYNFYNSGFIPYQGSGSNTYTLNISKTAKPGEHFFYCNYHGPFMSGFLVIKPTGTKIESPAAEQRAAQQEIDKLSSPLLREFRNARAGKYVIPPDAAAFFTKRGLARTVGKRTYAKAWLEGLGAEHVDNGLVNEFIPKTLHAKVGEKLTWVVIGDHTLTFNVPKYFPIIRVAKNGTVSFNPKINGPAGGAPDITKLIYADEKKPPVVDAGSWNGKGFRSSGLMTGFDFPVVYSLRITKPGTYKFACLIHPPMVGTITITK